MMPWVIFQITSNHSVLLVSHYAPGIRGEERRLSVWLYGDRQAEDERLILTLLGRAVSEHEA